jgi:23S rRNA pseudouridine2605 synthase
MTDDHQLAEQLTNPLTKTPKRYHVMVDRAVLEADLEALGRGLTLEDGSNTRPCEARVLKAGERTTWLEVTRVEGKNRQIRRMCRALVMKVIDLVRVAIGALELGDLKRGECRRLSKAEVASLRSQIPNPRAGAV